jgi:hypothetical protein
VNRRSIKDKRFTIFETTWALRCEWIALCRRDISFNIHPESQDKINDQGGTHSEKRNIDKPGANPGGRDAKALPNSCTNTEHLPLNELLHPVHACKLKKND